MVLGWASRWCQRHACPAASRKEILCLVASAACHGQQPVPAEPTAQLSQQRMRRLCTANVDNESGLLTEVNEFRTARNLNTRVTLFRPGQARTRCSASGLGSTKIAVSNRCKFSNP